MWDVSTLRLLVCYFPVHINNLAAATCILGRVASTESAYLDMYGKFSVQPLYDKFDNNSALEASPLMEGYRLPYLLFNEWVSKSYVASICF